MHPTGFPAYTIIGGLFAHVAALGAVSWRMALFSALATSGAAWLLYRAAVVLECEPWFASLCACAFALGQITWSRGTRAEVHTLALFFGMLTVERALVWYRTGDRRALVAGALAWGLGIATHPIAALLAPALVVLFALRMRIAGLRAIAAAAGALCCGLALYAYLPLRSEMVTAQRIDPTLALGLAPGKPFWDTNHPAVWNGFVREVTGEDFSSGGALLGMINPQTYTSHALPFLMMLLAEITPLGVLLALGGLYALVRRDRWLGIAVFLACACPAAFAFSYTIEADAQRYYLLSFAVALLLAAYGASAIVRALSRTRHAVLILVGSMAAALLVINHGTFAQRHDSGAQAVIDTVVEKTPPNAILIAPWLYATPLAYAAYVEHRLGGRVVDCGWYSDERLFIPRWTRKRPVFVVGQLFGTVPGFHTKRLPGSPDLFEVVKDRL